MVGKIAGRVGWERRTVACESDGEEVEDGGEEQEDGALSDYHVYAMSVGAGACARA